MRREMQQQNPFWVGRAVPPERFLGRRELARKLCDLVRSRQSVNLHGENGMGKGSLLRYLESELPWRALGWQQDWASILFVRLNCATLEPFQPAKLWKAILEGLGNHPQARASSAVQIAVAAALAATPSRGDDLRPLLRQMGQEGLYLALLLYDYDIVLQTHPEYDAATARSHLQDFRSLAVSNPDGDFVAEVVATRRFVKDIGPPTRRGSPWYNHYVRLPVLPFEEKEVGVVLELLPQALGHLKEPISRLAGGHPTLLQHACWLAWDTHQAGDSLEIVKLISGLEQGTRHVLEDLWESSTREEQLILLLTAVQDLGGQLGSQNYRLDDLSHVLLQYSHALRSLYERGLILGDPMFMGLQEGKQYPIFSPIMTWWVAGTPAITEAEQVRRRQLLLGRMSREQVERVGKVLTWLWDQRNEFASFIGTALGRFIPGGPGT
jgi:hypothetical protein